MGDGACLRKSEVMRTGRQILGQGIAHLE